MSGQRTPGRLPLAGWPLLLAVAGSNALATARPELAPDLLNLVAGAFVVGYAALIVLLAVRHWCGRASGAARRQGQTSDFGRGNPWGR